MGKVCYFDGDAAFRKRFNKTCFKPLFNTHESTDKKNKNINYKQIKERFGDPINILVNKKFDNSKDNYLLVIEAEQKTYMGTQYHPTHIIKCDNRHNINAIRNQLRVKYDDPDIDDESFS